MPGLARPTFFPPPPPSLPLFFFFFFSFFLSFLSFLFISFFAARSIPTTYFGLFSPVCAPLPPLPPPGKKKNGNSRGPVHGFLVNFAATSANEHDTKKRIRPCNRAIFVALSTCRKKEGSVCIYVFYCIRIFCSIGRRSGAILEIM